jgi:hypothetical protein
MNLLSSKERESLLQLQLLLGVENKKARELFETVGVAAFMAYEKGQPLVIPFIGSLTLTSERDITTEKGLEAVIECKFEPSAFLKRCVGQSKDGNPTIARDLMENRFFELLEETIEGA